MLHMLRSGMGIPVTTVLKIELTTQNWLRSHSEIHLLVDLDKFIEHALLASQESRDGIGFAETGRVVITSTDLSTSSGTIGNTL